ncbi:MAG: phosphoenolpyruvate synthase, partial [Catenulispora sp.]|nr:phosphoenolpyruvate synthase [Catenulispora sp.]
QTLDADLGDADVIEEHCEALQQAIRAAEVPHDLRNEITQAITEHLPSATLFVVRSSSNAEDLAGFSAAGLYHSVVGVPTADDAVEAVKEVWASTVSARAVQLRHSAGITLSQCFMSAIIQEQVRADVGGVLVTCDPLAPRDFRTVSVNAAPRSTTEVVSGRTSPIHYLCNTVEGGSRTVSLGSSATDLGTATKAAIRRLALISRLMQAHFAPAGNPAEPVDIEWAVEGGRIHLLQVRPFPVAD